MGTHAPGRKEGAFQVQPVNVITWARGEGMTDPVRGELRQDPGGEGTEVVMGVDIGGSSTRALPSTLTVSPGRPADPPTATPRHVEPKRLRLRWARPSTLPSLDGINRGSSPSSSAWRVSTNHADRNWRERFGRWRDHMASTWSRCSGPTPRSRLLPGVRHPTAWS